MIYLQLFLCFFQIGLFSIGGGYAAMPLIQDLVVDRFGWITMDGFADIVTIAEMTPGPIAVNAATFVGIQTAGIPGAVVATAGNVCPSCIIIFLLAYLYYKYQKLDVVSSVMAGIRPAVVAMIGSAGLSLLWVALYGQRTVPQEYWDFDVAAAMLFVAAILILRICKVRAIYIMIGTGVAFLIIRCGMGGLG